MPWNLVYTLVLLSNQIGLHGIRAKLRLKIAQQNVKTYLAPNVTLSEVTNMNNQEKVCVLRHVRE